MSVQSEMTRLADGTRRRFNVSGKLSLHNIIDIITPPLSNPNLLSGTDNFLNFPDSWVTFMNSGLYGSFQGLNVDHLNNTGLVGKMATYEPGTYTFSAFAKSDEPTKSIGLSLGFKGDIIVDHNFPSNAATGEWQRFTWTTNFNKKVQGRFQVSCNSNSSTTLSVAGLKVETSSFTTPYLNEAGAEITAPLYKVGGVIRTALSAFRQHFKSHFFEKRGVD